MKCLTTLVFAGLAASAEAARGLDLSGEWRFALDPSDLGSRSKPEDWRFPDKIRLPGMVTAQGFGEAPSIRTKWTGDGWRYPELFKEWQADGNFKFPFFLQPPRHYVGPAWFKREIEIPEDWQGSSPELLLERVHWQSTVWVDGREIGQCDSLGTPHVFNLGGIASGKHLLTLRIDNRLSPVNVGPLSHSVTDHTQGNWNGVVGRMELKRRAGDRIERVRVATSMDGSIKLKVSGCLAETGAGKPVVEIHDRNGNGLVARAFPLRKGDGSFEIDVAGRIREGLKLWNEFEPSLRSIDICLLNGNETPADRKTLTTGFREVAAKDGRLTINGRKTFMRGTLECGIFPLTGHPPTDVESWKRIVRICKAHGLNHIRFHSWCPPEAAFTAADELGFYYQVEVSSWANQGAQIGSGRALDEWIEKESKRMLDVYGHHPSFVLMAYGNEPAGENHARWLQKWVARRKAEDPGRLYTTGAGWPVMPGSDFHSSPAPRIQQWGEGMNSVINGQPPRTDFDWSGFVKQHADAPVISHEIGQWCVYPNFAGIPKYTGYFKARNFEIFQETARRNGLLDLAPEFLNASGKLQALAYKHDIEAALRTPGFGGFQLLDLHDFPGQGTALVGVLDAFWDEKGYITPGEYRRFCGPMVPLARMRKLVFSASETLEAELELAQFGPKDLKRAVPFWSIAASDGSTVASGKLEAGDLVSGELHRLGGIRVPLAKVLVPAKLRLTVGIEGEDALNSWDLFVYPAARPPETNDGSVTVTRDLAEAKSTLSKGGRVLWMPDPRSIRDDPDRPLQAGFSPIFWNTAWTEWQPPHTLGILCDPQHPALASFPTDHHSNWQWWEIQRHSRPFILTKHAPLQPVVRIIDDWVTNRKLGYLFEARVGEGLLVACGADLIHSEGKPAARQLLASVLGYMKSGKFSPTCALAADDLDALVIQPSGGEHHAPDEHGAND